MNLQPVIVIDGILLTITVLLAAAEKLLVSYGKCKISVSHEKETKEFEVDGGIYLHSALSDNGIPITSSCGGKATCGYCRVKVLEGGGQILPTEEIFMGSQEQRAGMRLACQVKIKQDIKVEIPDYLTTVRSMVKSGTFDSKLTWRVAIDGRTPEIMPKQKLSLRISMDDQTALNAILEEERDPRGSMIPVLQTINQRFNYLPEDFIRYTADRASFPLSDLCRLASFYNAFSLEPRGRFVLTVCSGTACHVKGAQNLISILEDELGIQREQTSEDLLFTLKTVHCVGCCGLAPVVLEGSEAHGLMGRRKTLKLVEDLKASAKGKAVA